MHSQMVKGCRVEINEEALGTLGGQCDGRSGGVKRALQDPPKKTYEHTLTLNERTDWS